MTTMASLLLLYATAALALGGLLVVIIVNFRKTGSSCPRPRHENFVNGGRLLKKDAPYSVIIGNEILPTGQNCAAAATTTVNKLNGEKIVEKYPGVDAKFHFASSLSDANEENSPSLPLCCSENFQFAAANGRCQSPAFKSLTVHNNNKFICARHDDRTSFSLGGGQSSNRVVSRPPPSSKSRLVVLIKRRKCLWGSHHSRLHSALSVLLYPSYNCCACQADYTCCWLPIYDFYLLLNLLLGLSIYSGTLAMFRVVKSFNRKAERKHEITGDTRDDNQQRIVEPLMDQNSRLQHLGQFDNQFGGGQQRGFSENSSFEAHEHYERKVQRVKKTKADRDRATGRLSDKKTRVIHKV